MNSSSLSLKETVHKLEAGIQKMIENQDADGFLSLYTSSAALLPPNSPRLTTSEEIRNFWKFSFENVFISGNLKVLEVEEFNEKEGMDSGSCTFIMKGEKETSEKHGKYLHTWKKENGIWKIHRSILNFDN